LKLPYNSRAGLCTAVAEEQNKFLKLQFIVPTVHRVLINFFLIRLV